MVARRFWFFKKQIQQKVLHITIRFTFYSATLTIWFPNGYFRTCQNVNVLHLSILVRSKKRKDMREASFSTCSKLLFHTADFALTPLSLHKDKTLMPTQTVLMSVEHQETLTKQIDDGARSEVLCIIFRRFLLWNLHVTHSHNTTSNKKFILS